MLIFQHLGEDDMLNPQDNAPKAKASSEETHNTLPVEHSLWTSYVVYVICSVNTT